jgi:hypothetical protein
LSTDTSVQIKEYEPFASDSNLGWDNLIRWLGNGSEDIDDECYPKNIIRSIYILEKSIPFLNSAGYKSKPTGKEIDAMIVAEKQNGGSFTTNYFEPWSQILTHKFLNYLIEKTQEYKPNTAYEMHSF